MRVVKLCWGCVAVVLGAAALYVILAVTLGYFPVNRGFRPMPGGTEVFVCSNGVHTDFVLPARTPLVDWTRTFPYRDFAGPVAGFDHVGIGWGDLDFYRATPHWRDLRIGTALHALLGLGPAAVHVQYRRGPGIGERCGRLLVDDAQYRALAGYIEASLLASAAGGMGVPAGSGYGTTDAFYWSVGRFSVTKSCNVWVGEGLKAAGLPTGIWTPFAFLVLSHLPEPGLNP